MSKKATFKYNVKAVLNRETDEYTINVKTKGDYFEALMFGLESVARTLIAAGDLSKEKFLEKMGNTYDYIKEDLNNGN